MEELEQLQTLLIHEGYGANSRKITKFMALMANEISKSRDRFKPGDLDIKFTVKPNTKIIIQVTAI